VCGQIHKHCQLLMVPHDVVTTILPARLLGSLFRQFARPSFAAFCSTTALDGNNFNKHSVNEH